MVMEGRDWSYAAACQGMPEIASKPTEDRKRRRIHLPVSDGAWLCQYLELRLLVSRTETVRFQ